jgi:hydrogenase nickel incorporation protein HypA/HybF
VHELSICRSIVGIVAKHAEGRDVRLVNVRIGAMRQIIPDTLVYCWSLVTEGSEFDGTQLRVERVPARLRCNGCGHEQEMTEPVLVCSACSGQQVTMVAGDEFLITSLELAEV